MSTRTIGNYQVVATGTRGRTGVVHQARDIADGRPVELIELPGFGASDVSLWSAFEGVNTRLKSVRNKRLATSKTWSQSSENGAWYVTDPPRGISLEQFRESLQRVHWRQALMIIHEIAKALSFAHSRGVAHGNLSPMNVFVDIGGAVQIRRIRHALIPALSADLVGIIAAVAIVSLMYG